MSHILFKFIPKDIVYKIYKYVYEYNHSLMIAEINSKYLGIKKHFDISKQGIGYCTDDKHFTKFFIGRSDLHGCHDCTKITCEGFDNGFQVLYYKCSYSLMSDKQYKKRIGIEYNGNCVHYTSFYEN